MYSRGAWAPAGRYRFARRLDPYVQRVHQPCPRLCRVLSTLCQTLHCMPTITSWRENSIVFVPFIFLLTQPHYVPIHPTAAAPLHLCGVGAPLAPLRRPVLALLRPSPGLGSWLCLRFSWPFYGACAAPGPSQRYWSFQGRVSPRCLGLASSLFRPLSPVFAAEPRVGPFAGFRASWFHMSPICHYSGRPYGVACVFTSRPSLDMR